MTSHQRANATRQGGKEQLTIPIMMMDSPTNAETVQSSSLGVAWPTMALSGITLPAIIGS